MAELAKLWQSALKEFDRQVFISRVGSFNYNDFTGIKMYDCKIVKCICLMQRRGLVMSGQKRDHGRQKNQTFDNNNQKTTMTLVIGSEDKTWVKMYVLKIIRPFLNCLKISFRIKGEGPDSI